MADIPTAYPLTWPEAFPRAKTREAARFRTTLHKAIENVQVSLRAFARDSRKSIAGIVLSSNVTLGATKPADPAVAAWFTWDGLSVCIPVDRYSTVEANLQAIHHILEARRVELRHGTLALVRATMTGFLALPGPAKRSWSDVLGIPATATADHITAAYRRLAAERHPDKGGSADAMAELNRARDEAMRARS